MTLDVTIEKLVYGGEGLARTAEGIILVPGALPGEKIRIEPEPTKRGVRRARILETTSASPHRIAAPCPFFAECGGCQHQQITYEQQLEWKRSILQECFERIGKVKLDVPIELISADPWEYRNRVRLHARKSSGGFQLGFEKPASNVICPVDSCAISSPAIQRAIAALSGGELFDGLPDADFEIELVASDADRELLATITANFQPFREFGDKWLAKLPGFSSVRWETRTPGRGGRISPETIPTTWGGGGLTMRVGEHHFRLSHGSFFQTNRFLLGKMLETVTAGLQGERALDLYAGVGFFSLPLARQFTHVIAVESHPSAAADLQTNAGVAVSKIYPYSSTTEGFVVSRPAKQPWDLILVDPPRHGLATPVRTAVIDFRPKQIVYVSCDPTTLARDIAGIVAGGYKVTSIHLIDLFPQTYHLEAIVRLSR